jgi:hypothetical protein
VGWRWRMAHLIVVRINNSKKSWWVKCPYLFESTRWFEKLPQDIERGKRLRVYVVGCKRGGISGQNSGVKVTG